METEDKLELDSEQIDAITLEDALKTEELSNEQDEDKKEPDLREMVMAFLFVALKPVSASELATLTKSSEEEVLEVLDGLVPEISNLRLGLELKLIGSNYQLRTKPELGKVLQRLITPKMKRLSKAAAETLAVIAYKQPVSKAEIEAIRGVDALPTLKTLLDGRLVRIVGREDTPGSPALYGTTDFFLERFGLKDLSELPTIREVRELADEMSEIEVEDSDESEENSEDEVMVPEENLTSH